MSESRPYEIVLSTGSHIFSESPFGRHVGLFISN